MTTPRRLLLLPHFARVVTPNTDTADARALLNAAVMEPKWRLQQVHPNNLRAVYCGASRDDEGGEVYFTVLVLSKKMGVADASADVATVLGWTVAQIDGRLCVGVPMPELLLFPQVNMAALRGKAVMFLRKKLIAAMAWETPVDFIEL